MNVFSSEAFLDALRAVYFPGRDATIGRFAVEGHEFQLLDAGGRRPEVRPPLVDYWEPVTPDGAAARALRSLPRVALETIPVDGRPRDLGPASPSPLVAFGELAGWDAFTALVHERSPRLASDSRRRTRRLEREVGPVTVVLDDRDDAAVDRCIAWKSAQFPSAARFYRDPRHAAFLRLLRDRGVAEVATLRAGDRVVAAHVGLRHEGRFSSWVPAYDAAATPYAPGRLLLEALLAATHARGDREFDFLVGNEPYKWTYATNTRLVVPLGPQPRAVTAALAARRRLRLGRRYRSVRRFLRRSGRPGG